jgi:hypothetical protein
MPAAPRVRVAAGSGWTLTPVAVAEPGRRRAGAVPPASALLDRLVQPGRLEIDQVLAATPSLRGVRAAGTLDFAVDARPGEAYVVAVLHPSGALTFHAPHDKSVRAVRGTLGPTAFRFVIALRETPGPPDRRGLVSGAVRVIVLKALGALVDPFLPRLAALWETAHWKRRGLNRGWLRVSRDVLKTGTALPRADLGALPAPPARNLLLLHGIFSNAEAAFHGLATASGTDGRDLFTALRATYEDRIFAFNHFSVSQTPEDNARSLLQALPARPALFDVVTHSRGGIVLRTLAERREELGAPADRFQLGRVVLVAAPNEGSPLASPTRWETFVGWLANLLDLFPENPFTLGLEFVSEALVWLAHRAGGAIPGIAAMATESGVIHDIQSPPPPPDGAYSALVANYEPDASLVERMLDAGVDAFFSSANDLVVPTEGGWRVDDGRMPGVAADRIGCFGAGGNIAADGAGVHHLNFFAQPATVDFIVRALEGRPQSLPRQDPVADLPYRGRRRAIAAAAPTPLPRALPVAERRAAADARPALIQASFGGELPAGASRDALQLFILSPAVDGRPGDAGARRAPRPGRAEAADNGHTAQLLATYRNARVVETFRTRGDEAGQRWRRIIAMQQRILNYIDGAPGARNLPVGAELIGFGSDLFETLFPGRIRRLYDVARAAQDGRRLDIVLTSMIDWVADKPWEFAYDPSRRRFLATEEVNFIRNVFTAVPADGLRPRDKLRILVVAAQPIGTIQLSSAEEIEVIRRGFRPLEDAGLAEVEICLRVTPDMLHQRLLLERYDVLHFIGHGEYDRGRKIGALLFEDERGASHRVESDTLRQILCQRGLRLIFLNACETGMGGRADFNQGVAPALVAGGVPTVVANQYKVLDPSATAFAQHFYWSLGLGQPLGDAARESRVAVNYSITGEALDWAVPVVYAQSPEDVLASGGRAAAATAPVAAPSVARRAARPERQEQIALWDVNHVIPAIDRIADTMTRAQEVYGFEAVNVAAPLGTWRFERRSSDDGGFLDAAKVAQRLMNKPRELGVDRLIGITNFRLGDDEYDELFVWDENGPVALVSTAGILEEIRGPGVSVERAIANLVVGCLADLPTHRRGPKDCPMYFNEEIAVQYIAGPLKFDRQCRARLARSDRPSLLALEKLLRAFP